MRRFIPVCFGRALVAGATPPAPTSTLRAGVRARPCRLRRSFVRHRSKPLVSSVSAVVMLAFGFSNCGEVCPIAAARGRAQEAGQWAGDVQVLYVTVDPERDDAAQMRKFLGSFDPTFVGGVGTRAQLDSAQKSYGISSSKTVQADGSYSIGHSSSIYLIDRAGRLAAVMPYGHPVDDFVHDLKILLRG
jgi:protein SCO1/2